MSPVTPPFWMTFARFNIVGALGIGVQLAALASLVGPAGVPYLPATVIAVSAALLHNFVWHLRWTWRARSGTRGRVGRMFGRFVLANGAVSLGGNVVVMTLATGLAGLPAVPANVVAIAVSGIVNYWLADRLVFWAPAVERPVE